jgi:hypothetical protein
LKNSWIPKIYNTGFSCNAPIWRSAVIEFSEYPRIGAIFLAFL